MMTVRTLSACGAIVLAAAVSPLVQGPATARPIPPGFDFPADEPALLKMRDNNDVAGMRRHVWLVFAGLTSAAPSGEAVWETWYSAEETFQQGPPPPGAAIRRPQRNFRRPRQFEPPGGAAPPAPGQSLASFTLFSAELRDFVQTQRLQKRATLKAINDGFTAQTPVADRRIPEFPRPAVALKTVWWIVKQSGKTVMPIFDPDLNPPVSNGNPPETWKRCVAVDAQSATVPAGQTTTVECNGRPAQPAHVVGLDSFYHFALTQGQIDAMRQTASGVPNLDTAVPGDFVALIAMHVTTKEIPDWIWATFWWHDKPDDGPFAANRPPEVKDLWRNYLMAESYSMDTPKHSDGAAHVAFNPWLEARFAAGTVSNCMTCHRRAVYSGKSSDGRFTPVTRGTPPAADPRFKDAIKLDFLWSVLFESR
jgi:hypothetical protein